MQKSAYAKRIQARPLLWVLGVCGAALFGTHAAHAQGDAVSAPVTTSVHWERVPVGEALARLSHAVGRPIFVDRRVDPDRRITLDVTGARTDELIEQLSAAASLGSSRLGKMIYFGPQAAADRLRTLSELREEEIGRLPAPLGAALARRRPFDWPRLSEPRVLVAGAIESRGWRLADGERIPHDLWAAGRLPPLTLAEQLTVLLVGFDLTFSVEPESRTIALVPISAPVALRRQYSLSGGVDVEQLQQQLPAAELDVAGNVLQLTGRLEDHEQLVDLLRGHARRAPGPDPGQRTTRQVFTLRVQEQPVGVVLRQLAESLGWTLVVDEGALRAEGLSLDRRVSFAVQNADADALLDALLRPAGLTHRRDGDHVRIVPMGRYRE